MAEQGSIVDRVSALMRPESTGARRRRSFIAGAGERSKETVEASVPTLPTLDDEDLPVLTEVVPDEPLVAPAEPPKPEPDDETLLAIIAADLVHSIENQLAIELPTLIEATLLSTQNELRNGISSTLEMALRDFLARRQQLRLPLDDPNQKK
jgi:hypothetical protein